MDYKCYAREVSFLIKKINTYFYAILIDYFDLRSFKQSSQFNMHNL